MQPDPLVFQKSHEGLMSVAYGNLVGLLIEAVKELADHIDRQARAISHLEAQQ